MASATLQINQQAREFTQSQTAILTQAMTGIGNLYEARRQFNETLGMTQQQFDETVRQFNDTLAIQLREIGMEETQVAAVVRQIDAQIKNSSLATSAQIAQDWANITGEVGTGTEDINAAFLGVDTTIPDNLTTEQRAAKRASIEEDIRLSFQAMMGREPTTQELSAMYAGNAVSVQGVPTLKARELGLQVMLQNQERVAKYAAIADEHGLNRDTFNQAVEESDRQWAVQIGNVAGQFGIDQDRFAVARFVLDNRVDAIMLNPALSMSEKNAQIDRAILEVGDEFFQGEQPQWMQANNLFDETHGNAQRQIAMASGMGLDQFLSAQRQADDVETRLDAVWAGAMETQEANIRDVLPDVVTEGKQTYIPLNRGAGAEARQEFGKYLMRLTDTQTAELRAAEGDATRTAAILRDIRSSDPEAYEELKNSMSAVLTGGQGFFTDPQFDIVLAKFIAAGEGDRLQIGVGAVGDSFSYTPHNWFAGLSDEKLESLLSTMGAGLSPDSSGGSFLSDISELIGTVSSAYATYKVAT